MKNLFIVMCLITGLLTNLQAVEKLFSKSSLKELTGIGCADQRRKMQKLFACKYMSSNMMYFF